MEFIMKQNITRRSICILCRTVINSPRVIIMAMAILVSACGGGGDDGTEITDTPASTTATTGTTTDTTTTPPPATVTPDPEPVPDPSSLDDLIVDADNTMQAAFELTIEIDIASQKRAYFSLCDDFSGSNKNNYVVNFESCQYRGPTTDGKLNTEIKIANHNGQLIAVLWYYDGMAAHYQIWQYDKQAQVQRLTINQAR